MFGIAAGADMQNWSVGTVGRALDDYGALHARWIRHDFAWDAIEPQRGTYTWAGFDQLVTAARSRGIDVIATITYTPAWANGGHSDHTYAPTAADEFGQFAGAVAGRYAPQGVHTYEIWNEPNIGFWKPTPDPQAYTAVLCSAYQRIHAADPAATVITGGTSPAGDGPSTYSPANLAERPLCRRREAVLRRGGPPPVRGCMGELGRDGDLHRQPSSDRDRPRRHGEEDLGDRGRLQPLEPRRHGMLEPDLASVRHVARLHVGRRAPLVHVLGPERLRTRRRQLVAAAGVASPTSPPPRRRHEGEAEFICDLFATDFALETSVEARLTMLRDGRPARPWRDWTAAPEPALARSCEWSSRSLTVAAPGFRGGGARTVRSRCSVTPRRVLRSAHADFGGIGEDGRLDEGTLPSRRSLRFGQLT